MHRHAQGVEMKLVIKKIVGEFSRRYPYQSLSNGGILWELLEDIPVNHYKTMGKSFSEIDFINVNGTH